MTACGGKGTGGTVTPKPTEESQTQSQGTKDTTPNTVTPEITSTEVSLDALLNHAETPAEDFDYRADGTYSYIYEYLGTDPIVVIPETLDGCPVKSVDGLTGCGIKAVKYSDSVELIEDRSFAFDANLQYVVFGSNIKEVGKIAFQGCENLEYLSLNETLEVINEGAFTKTAVKEIHIPESVKEIHGAPFNMNSTQTIYVKSNSYAEEYCTELSSKFENFIFIAE